MSDITPVDQTETAVPRFKKEESIYSGDIFTFGSKHGLVRAAIGRRPWAQGMQDIPNAFGDTLAVRLSETALVPGLTSRLQLVMGRDEQGTFYIENMSKIKEGSKGVPLRVTAPHFRTSIDLNPKSENSDNLSSRCLLGGTARSLKGVQVRWGTVKKGYPAYTLIVEDTSDSSSGWEAKVKYLHKLNE